MPPFDFAPSRASETGRSRAAVERAMAALFILALLTGAPQATAELGRWKRWEIERNDLVSNSRKFHALPTAKELKELQTDFIYKVVLPPQGAGILENSLARDVRGRFVDARTGEIAFFIHPAALGEFAHLTANRKLEIVKVDPTTSPRTFFLGDLNVKLSLPQKINGAIRTVYPLQMERALAVTEMLAEIPRDVPGYEHFGFLPEVMGIYDARADAPFGFLVRAIPKAIVNGTNTLVPLTAYCSQGPDGEKTLLELDATASGRSARAHVKSQVLPALLEAFTVAAEFGVVMEAHQQNVLLELTADGRFTGRIFFRDMDGGRVDFDLRARRGLSVRHLTSVSNASWVFNLDQARSLNQAFLQQGERPVFWTGLAERAFQTYLLGSSVYLLEATLSRLKPGTTPEDSLQKTAIEELKRIARGKEHPGSCRALFGAIQFP